MKKIAILVFCLTLFVSKDFAQCVNADFSLGNFNGWTGSAGENVSGVYTNIVPGIVAGVPNSPPSDTGRQTIMNVPGTDHNTGGLLSVLPPNGTSSCRLGNERVAYDIAVSAHRQAERLEYVLAVDQTNCMFTYKYAVVLQDPSTSPHAPSEKPKLIIYVLDAPGDTINSYEVTASSTLPGFNTCAPDPGVYDPSTNVVWKDWTPVVIDLSQYIGQNITIQFTTYDCSLGGHFGYAYIACSCGNTTSINEINNKENNITAYPNPANDIISVDFPGYLAKENAVLEIQSIDGKLLKSQQISGKITEVDLKDMSSGIYFIKVKNNNGVAVKKVIKE